MRDLLVRKLKMYTAVLAVLNAWFNFWNALTAFTDDHSKLAKFISDIEEKNKALTDSTLVSEEKKQKYEEMILLGSVVCGAGTSYANKINDHVLARAFNYVPFTLRAGNEEDVCKRCAVIAEMAEPIKDQLVNHNLPIEKVPLLAATSVAYGKLIAAPHVAIKNHKSDNAALELLYTNCDQFLKGQLDKDMMTFIATQPDFYAQYTTAREIGGWSSVEDKGNGGNGGNV